MTRTSPRSCPGALLPVESGGKRGSPSIGAVDIPAEVKPGGRIEALKCALSVNAVHGLRRSNADKRRAVEIALREFPKLSDRAISELCGVDHKTVASWRPSELGKFPNATRTTSDGRQYPATKPAPEPEDVFEETDDPDEPTPAKKSAPKGSYSDWNRMQDLSDRAIRLT